MRPISGRSRIISRARFLQILALFVPAGLEACGGDSSLGPGEVPAVILPARQWSAGTVMIEWPWLENVDSLPAFVAGGSVVPAERIGETTVLVRLPHTRSGPIAIVAYVDEPFGISPARTGFTLGTVDVVGFSEVVSAPVLLPWPLSWPEPAGTAVLGRDVAGNVIRFDLESGLAEPVPLSLPVPPPGRSVGYPFVGWGGGPGRVVVSDPLEELLQVWDLSAPTSPVAELPVEHHGMQQAHLLAPDRLFMADDDNMWVFSRAPESGDWVETFDDRTIPYEAVRSPAGNRVAVMMRHSDDLGMLYVLTGDGSGPAFFLPTLTELFAGTFTREGASLVLAVHSGITPRQRLVRVSAVTGEVEAEVLLDSPAGVDGLGRVENDYAVERSAVAATPGRVLLAVNDWTDPGQTALRVRLLVLRAADLGFVAELRAPPSAGQLTENTVLAVTADGSEALLYDYQAKRFRFSLLPE